MKLTEFVDDEELSETAGGTSVGSIATGGGTGFADGSGIGSRYRAGKMSETHVPGHEDHEVSMAHGDAQNLAKNSIHLAQMLQNTSEQQGLPGWVSAYITLANDYLESVTQYLSHQASGDAHE